MNVPAQTVQFEITDLQPTFLDYIQSQKDENTRTFNIQFLFEGDVLSLSGCTATATVTINNIMIEQELACAVNETNNYVTVVVNAPYSGVMAVQVTLASGNDILTMPRPLYIRVTQDIAETAQIDENSLGSYAEVVQEIAEARGTYTTLHDALAAKAPLSTAYTFDAMTTNVVYDANNPKKIYTRAIVNGKNAIVLTTSNNYFQFAFCHDGTEYIRELTSEGSTTYNPWLVVKNENTNNKKSEINDSNRTSTQFYPSIKAVVDYIAANYEALSNKLSSEAGIDSNSTDTEYPTAKAVFDFGGEILALVNDDISNVESRLVLKESFSNKKNAIVGNETSEQYYPSIKAVVDYLAALEINAGSVGFDETETYAAGSIGAEVSAQKNAIKNLEAIPTEVKRAMDTLFSKAAYADDDAASSYATFHAWAIANPVNSITAVFTQGSATIYDTDSLDTLKQYLVVTATYADSTSVTVTDYTLSGTLTKGTSTITVSYGGKTTTFNVTVTEDSLIVQPNITYAYDSGKLEASENRSATSLISIDDTSITHTVSAAVNGVEVDILLRVFDQNGIALNTNGLAKSQTIPARDYKCFGVVLAQVVTSNDVVAVIVDGIQNQARYGTLEEYSNTVPVDIQVGGIDGTTGEIIENPARLITGFIDIVPVLWLQSAPPAQLLLTAPSGVYVKVFEYSDSSFLQNSFIGYLDSNQTGGNPESACTKFRVLFKKSDNSNFTSADIESLTLNNHDIVTYEFTEVN